MIRLRCTLLILAVLATALLSFSAGSVTGHLTARDTVKIASALWPKTFGFGKPATPAEITAWDIDIRPDGRGLPAGTGTASEGRVLYVTKCAACHGAEGRELPGVKLPAPVLVSDTTFKGRKSNTIGNYWPYATTVFDYIRRSMPYNAPGTLTDKEVYSVTAYLLNANGIIAAGQKLNAQTLPKVIMPAKKLFIADDRKGGTEVK